MDKNDLETKQERHEFILTLIQTQPGIKRPEITRRLGVNRSTVMRDLRDLSLKWNINVDEENGYYLSGDRFLRDISFSQNEVIYVYLACRLVAEQLDQPSGLAASTLRKVSESIRSHSPAMANQILDDAEALEAFRNEESARQFSQALMAATDSWDQRKLISFKYPSKSDECKEREAVVLQILPNLAGRTFMILAGVPGFDEPKTYRLDRMREARITDKEFRWTGIDRREWLKYAWHTWGGAAEPETVVLRFSPDAASRVRETRWHATEILEEEETDGSLRLILKIAGIQEMYPWIRSWGAGVEVLAPESLREWHREEIGKMQKLYQDGTSPE